MNVDRDSLLAGLTGPDGEQAKAELLAHPDWLAGPPPGWFLDMLIVAYLDALAPPLDIARSWARPDMAQALLNLLVRKHDRNAREALAWLLSQMPWAPLTHDLVNLIARPEQATIVRRWLAKALDLLAFAGEIAWPDVAGAVEALTSSGETSLRQAAAGICGSLPHADSARKTLIALLEDVDSTVVESALHMLLLQGARLDTPRIRQLADHPNREIAERATKLLNLKR